VFNLRGIHIYIIIMKVRAKHNIILGLNLQEIIILTYTVKHNNRKIYKKTIYFINEFLKLIKIY
jgi:hypothetical protein